MSEPTKNQRKTNTRRTNTKIRKAYEFLVKVENQSQSFTAQELADASGWTNGSTTTYLSKQLKPYIAKNRKQYTVKGIVQLQSDQFDRLMSQVTELSSNPTKPILQPEVSELVEKARQSALVAVQVYNNPIGCFRTETFSILMMVAWTALAQAEFTRDGVDFNQYNEEGNVVVIDKEPKAWELGESINHMRNLDLPIKKNIELFIKLRNWIVHRGVRALDAAVAGECQALLLNFDERLVNSFGKYYAISESLALPLVTGNVRDVSLLKGVSAVQRRHFEEVMQLVREYRRNLDDQVFEDQRYSFRVFVMPRPGNRQSTSDLAIDFVRLEQVPDEFVKWMQSRVIGIKTKTVPTPNLGLKLPSKVAQAVKERTGFEFAESHHTRAWKRYKVRPVSPKNPDTESRYCLLDDATKQYVYTPAWVDFLVDKLKDPIERAELRVKDEVQKSDKSL